MTKVKDITEFIFMPMSWLVSKSFATARIAMPIFVYLMSATSPITSASTSIGVITVTILVVAPHIVICFDRNGIAG